MKKCIYIAVVSILLGSCGGSSPEDNPPIPQNKIPTTPTLVYPTNNLLCIDNILNFQWNTSTDPDGDAITYQIQIATDNQFTQITQTINESSTSRTITLEKGIAYYWRVKAVDSKNASSSYSTVFQFYTEGIGVSNYLPFSPTLVAPPLSSTEQGATATLEWTASDVDNDPLTFDIYFGSTTPPALLAENQTQITYTSPTLNPLTDYYWKIVVKDGKGGQTVGQIWNFKTN